MSRLLFKLFTINNLEAEVGIGLCYPWLRLQYARFHWLLNINQHNPTIPFITLLVSVLVSACSGRLDLRASASSRSGALTRASAPVLKGFVIFRETFFNFRCLTTRGDAFPRARFVL